MGGGGGGDSPNVSAFQIIDRFFSLLLQSSSNRLRPNSVLIRGQYLLSVINSQKANLLQPEWKINIR